MDPSRVLSAKSEYDQIIISWDRGDSVVEVYHQILYWIKNYKSIIKAQDDISDIYSRMLGHETADVITLDFIYSEKYDTLRNEFNS